jgi:hypothetical protein
LEHTNKWGVLNQAVLPVFAGCICCSISDLEQSNQWALKTELGSLAPSSGWLVIMGFLQLPSLPASDIFEQ